MWQGSLLHCESAWARLMAIVDRFDAVAQRLVGARELIPRRDQARMHGLALGGEAEPLLRAFVGFELQFSFWRFGHGTLPSGDLDSAFNCVAPYGTEIHFP